MAKPNILVIKHGALGDFWICTEAFAAIRAHHPDAHITLLTTEPYFDLAQKSPWFDTVWIDKKPKFWQVAGWLNLRKRLLSGNFTRVYDLQTSDRSAIYFNLFKPNKPPEWAGHVAGASHRHSGPERDKLHALHLRRHQLVIAGITELVPIDYHWLNGDLTEFHLPPRIAIIVAGSSPRHPEKRWPSEKYAALGRRLTVAGIRPVLLGTNQDAEINKLIYNECVGAVNLTGKTDFGQIASLARIAHVAIGNDTGPMHLIAQLGCPTLTLFSSKSNPDHSRPLGRMTAILQQPDLRNLDVKPVWETVKKVVLPDMEDESKKDPA